MNTSFDGIHGDGEVSRVRGEDCNGITGRESVDCLLVGFGIALVVGRERVEGRVEAIVNFGDVLVQVVAYNLSAPRVRGYKSARCSLTDGGKLVSRGSYHAQVPNLTTPPQVKQHQSDNTDLLVGARSTAAYETGRVFAGSDHTNIQRSHDVCERWGIKTIRDDRDSQAPGDERKETEKQQREKKQREVGG